MDILEFDIPRLRSEIRIFIYRRNDREIMKVIYLLLFI